MISARLNSTRKLPFDNRIVRDFALASIIFGVTGMTAGFLVSFMRTFPGFGSDLPCPFSCMEKALQSNVLIFAFVGNAIFMGVYHSLQRLCNTRLYSDVLSRVHFWGWQLLVPLSVSVSNASLAKIFPALGSHSVQIVFSLVWLVFGINFFGTVFSRRVRKLNLAVWFYIASFTIVAALHLSKSIEFSPAWLSGLFQKAGWKEALSQWWAGQNAVAFFLTTPFLGLMYYYMPKMTNRRLSAQNFGSIHFIVLIFIYLWAGPHHFLYSSLPEWAGSIGTLISVAIVLPGLGGTIKGLFHFRKSADKVQHDHLLKFIGVRAAAFGMAGIEGSFLSLKNVNAVAHFTDWVIAHINVGDLGWNGFLAFAMLYYIVPAIFQTRIYSGNLVSVHLWLGTLGIVLYAVSMLLAAFYQSPKGAEFLYSVLNTQAGHIPHLLVDFLRTFGGGIYLAGVVIMGYNLVKTMLSGALKPEVNAVAAIPFFQKTNFGLAFLNRIMESNHFILAAFMRCFPALLPQGSLEIQYSRVT